MQQLLTLQDRHSSMRLLQCAARSFNQTYGSLKNKFSATSENLDSLIQINHQPDATIFQFIILTFVYSSTCFGRFPAHHQELNDCSDSLWFYLRIVVTAVLCSWSGWSVGRPDHEHSTTVTTIRW
jgi:hypothetical protein